MLLLPVYPNFPVRMQRKLMNAFAANEKLRDSGAWKRKSE
jgi:hypothetical protein